MSRTRTQQDLTWTDLRRQPDDARPPAALLIGALLVGQLAWVGVGHGMGLSATALVAGITLSTYVVAFWLTLPSALAAGGLAFLLADGFVQGSYGTLVWDGAHDLALLGGLVLGCVLAAEAAYELRWSRPRRREQAEHDDPLRTPWWYDDELVALSLTLPDPQDVGTTEESVDDSSQGGRSASQESRSDVR